MYEFVFTNVCNTDILRHRSECTKCLRLALHRISANALPIFIGTNAMKFYLVSKNPVG